MRNYCKDVKHIVDTITELPQGYDLYVDATGFERRFTKDSEEIELNHHLVNSAWVYSLEYDGINPFTKSIARTNGWQFEIDLQNRTGTGYVFSDKFINDDDALEELKSWTNRKIITEPKLIKWKPSVLKNAWSDNIVTIGLGQGFIDPLESNGLYMVVYSITLLVKCILKGSSPQAYNRTMSKVHRDNSNYILHHYMLSQRDDTDFWKYYKKFDATKTVWDEYLKKTNEYTNLYPDAIWAQLGLYFDAPKPS